MLDSVQNIVFDKEIDDETQHEIDESESNQNESDNDVSECLKTIVIKLKMNYLFILYLIFEIILILPIFLYYKY